LYRTIQTPRGPTDDQSHENEARDGGRRPQAEARRASPPRTYDSLDKAFTHFNRALFDDRLPPCLITLRRHGRCYGYFSGSRFADVADARDVTDEIALNPDHFAGRPAAKVLATLVHEMVHGWQHHFGKPSRRGYHNREWAGAMHEVGLVPSDTGEPGGRETGQRMTHYIQPGGAFDVACAAYLGAAGPVLYQDLAGPGEARRGAKSKTKYTCPGCGLNAWAKPDTHLVCGGCGDRLELEPDAAPGAVVEDGSVGARP
jgi:hypothetical protein